MYDDNFYADTAEAAKAVLREFAVPAVLGVTDQLEADGLGQWIPDPEVYHVWGFRTGDGKILAIVYIKNTDFETGEELDRMMADFSPEV